MNWYFIVICALGLISLGISMGKHGQKHPDYSGVVSFISYVIEIALIYMAIKVGF